MIHEHTISHKELAVHVCESLLKLINGKISDVEYHAYSTAQHGDFDRGYHAGLERASQFVNEYKDTVNSVATLLKEGK